MTALIESPWPALVLAAALVVVLVIALVRTGRAIFLAAIGAVVLLAIGAVMLERAIVTEREEVEDALDAVARALEFNDVPAVLAAFSPTCARLGEVRSALGRFEVRSARVGGDLEVRLNPLTNPPSATTYFTGRVEGKDKRGVVPYENMIRKFKVTLHREGGSWLIADYSDADLGERRR